MIEIGTIPQCPRCRTFHRETTKRDIKVRCKKCNTRFQIWVIERNNPEHQPGIKKIQTLYICTANPLDWMTQKS